VGRNDAEKAVAVMQLVAMKTNSKFLMLDLDIMLLYCVVVRSIILFGPRLSIYISIYTSLSTSTTGSTPCFTCLFV
jgi:hypothetical protein